MGKILKIQKTHIYMQRACEKLKDTKEQFKKLLIHLNVKAQNVKHIYRLSCSDTSTYSIKDINRIYNSKFYLRMVENNKKMQVRETWLARNRKDIANSNKDLEYDYIEVLKQKYSTFSDAIADLGESLTFLYIFKFFTCLENNKLNDSDEDNKTNNEFKCERNGFINNNNQLSILIDGELKKIENFITKNNLIGKIYYSKKDGMSY